MNKKLLFLIPARGGSKGIPGKNVKLLNGKPLIHYSIEFARLFSGDEDICVSTDDQQIIHCVESTGLNVPFIRPDHLATDEAGTFGVVLHALSYYRQMGREYQGLVLLQPTSPFRRKIHFREAVKMFDSDTDMVVSVIESPYNPYFNLFEENPQGHLVLSKSGDFEGRQAAPPVYAYNGLLYIIDTRAMEKYPSFSSFQAIKKYLMPAEYSIDLDTPDDWNFAEYIAGKKKGLWEI